MMERVRYAIALRQITAISIIIIFHTRTNHNAIREVTPVTRNWKNIGFDVIWRNECDVEQWHTV